MKSKLSVLFTSLLLLLAACSNATNEEVVATPASTPTATAEVKEEVVEEVVEEVSEPVSYLQDALERLKTVNTISYMSSVSESYYYYSNESNTLSTTTDYVYSMNGELRRSPAAAKVDATSSSHVLEYDANGTNTFEDYSSSESTSYMSEGEGMYYKSDYDDIWYQYYLSDDFRTIEHIEDVVKLFLLNPEELVIIDGFGEGNDPDMAIIQYNLTTEQFVELSTDFRQSFFTGVYDLTDIDYGAPKVEDMQGLYLDITVDKDYNIYSYTISYSDKYVYDETANPEDFHGYSLTVYFNEPNAEFFGELPEDVRESAVSNY